MVNNALQNFGTGLFTALATQPFDVLRTSMVMEQNKQFKQINFQGLFQLTRYIYNEKGLRGLYRGSDMAILKSIAGITLFFTNLEYFNKLYDAKQKKSKLVNFFTAATAKFFTTAILNPIIVIKTKQENSSSNFRLKYISNIYKNEGLGGFYKGILVTLCRDIPWSGLQYTIYMFLLDQYQVNKKQEANLSYIFFAGGVSTILSTLCVYPFDNLRVRIQASNQKQKINVIARDLLRTQGWASFYEGYLPRIMKKGIAGSLVWTINGIFKDKNQL